MMPRSRTRGPIQIRGVPEIVEAVEKAQGVASPSDALLLCRTWRALVATNRAQKDVIAKLGADLKAAWKVNTR
jgi:hypothetical protein